MLLEGKLAKPLISNEQTWDFPRLSSQFAGPATEVDLSGKRKLEIYYVKGT